MLWETELGNARVKGTLHGHNLSNSVSDTPRLRVYIPINLSLILIGKTASVPMIVVSV